MNVLAWVTFGIIIGFIATIRDSKSTRAEKVDIVTVGIIGAIVGGFLGNILFGVTIKEFNISAFIVAIMGTIALLYISKSITTNTNKKKI